MRGHLISGGPLKACCWQTFLWSSGGFFFVSVYVCRQPQEAWKRHRTFYKMKKAHSCMTRCFTFHINIRLVLCFPRCFRTRLAAFVSSTCCSMLHKLFSSRSGQEHVFPPNMVMQNVSNRCLHLYYFPLLNFWSTSTRYFTGI